MVNFLNPSQTNKATRNSKDYLHIFGAGCGALPAAEIIWPEYWGEQFWVVQIDLPTSHTTTFIDEYPGSAAYPAGPYTGVIPTNIYHMGRGGGSSSTFFSAAGPPKVDSAWRYWHWQMALPPEVTAQHDMYLDVGGMTGSPDTVSGNRSRRDMSFAKFFERHTSSNNFFGEVAEIRFYNYVTLTGPERAAIISELQTKWTLP
jgi:hypothetical protein